MDGYVDGWMDGRTDGRMDEWVDGWIRGRMDGWMSGLRNTRRAVNEQYGGCFAETNPPVGVRATRGVGRAGVRRSAGDTAAVHGPSAAWSHPPHAAEVAGKSG